MIIKCCNMYNIILLLKIYMPFTNKKKIKWIFFKVFANLNFAICILFFILFFSMLGSVIEQHQSLAYYQELYPVQSTFINFNWKAITFLGLDNIYESWWFLIILMILSCSLITCTFSVQLPSLRYARRWKFINRDIYTQPKVSFTEGTFVNKSMVNIVHCLNNKGYYCFSRQNKVYAYKGLIGRIAPIIVHISLILILIGATIGFTSGFIVQEMIPIGEVFHLKNILGSGFNNVAPIYLTFRIDDFYLNYNVDRSIKQFFSKLSYINDDGNKKVYPAIFVNSPLILKGMTFYQTDWQMNALRIQLDSSCTIQYKLNKVQIGKSIFWICRFPLEKTNHIFIIISSFNDSIYIYDSLGKFISVASLRQKVYVGEACFRVKEIMSSTGIQIKVDPGLSLVYLGFGFLIISTFISYISYSQLWFSISDNYCYLNGYTNRAVLYFEEELINIYHKYIENCM
uniref:Cytochrome c biogenesis protein CcsB n=1 Tax=Campylaephora sungminbooi TaxID=1896769 RepID=A0A1B0RRE1_9FLOR|nr:cytochrome c biogenesis protein ccs1 [Campylaephora sungminbooi]AKU47334.1 cytochrome c biogenesis protein ccs1 [Campylaephora sungminbooi]ALN11781.1 cytochrome c biogenesis protein ccs1 [Campylaephora sungminbooi]